MNFIINLLLIVGIFHFAWNVAIGMLACLGAIPKILTVVGIILLGYSRAIALIALRGLIGP